MILADTDVLIDYLDGKAPAAGWVAQALRRDQLQTTVISFFELLSGAGRPREREIVSALLENVWILPLDVEAARQAADARRQLERAGLPIGMGDSLIAGIALAHGAILLTRNTRHFERVPGLKLAGMESGNNRQSRASNRRRRQWQPSRI